MKIIRFILIAVLAISAANLFAQDTKTDSIKVSGNCSTCKKNIEKAALGSGALKAFWKADSNILTVSYSTSKTTNDAIQKKVASVGYDTEKYRGDDKAYDALDDCCQYDRKKSKH